MEREFVPYEIALELKELGFNEPCMMNHYGNKRLHIGRLYLPSSFGKGKNSEMYDDSLRDGDVTAVLYQQAFRWFREKYDLMFPINKDDIGQYYFSIPNSDRLLDTKCYCYASYEEAELECLKKLIEIVKDGRS